MAWGTTKVSASGARMAGWDTCEGCGRHTTWYRSHPADPPTTDPPDSPVVRSMSVPVCVPDDEYDPAKGYGTFRTYADLCTACIPDVIEADQLWFGREGDVL